MISDKARQAALELLLRNAEPVTLVMRGTSMFPTLREGDRIQVRSLQRDPRVGDVVLFTEGTRWIAHRVVGYGDGYVICAGDAQPDSLERVPLGTINGIVEMPGLNGLVGPIVAWLRPLRALLRTVDPRARERVYRTLVYAARAIVLDDRHAFVRAVDGVVPWKLAAVARRHRLAPLLGRVLTGDADLSEHARALAARVAPDHYRALLAAPHFREQVREVLRILRAATIEPVLLKGAARALAGEADAESFVSQDIDLLVQPDEVEAARTALIAAGYTGRVETMDYERHHHAAPLFPPVGGVPVEIHRALGKGVTARRWTRATLAPFVTQTQGEDRAFVLDAIGATLHHALHAAPRAELREILILARRLRSMSNEERSKLRSLLPDEAADAVPIASVLAFAAYLARIPWRSSKKVRRYVRWSILREDLPRPMRVYPACADAWLGALTEPGLVAALRAAIRAEGSTRRFLGAGARALSGLAIWLYAPLMRR